MKIPPTVNDLDMADRIADDDAISDAQANAIAILNAVATRLRSQIKNGSMSAHGRRIKRAKLRDAIDALEWAQRS